MRVQGLVKLVSVLHSASKFNKMLPMHISALIGSTISFVITRFFGRSGNEPISVFLGGMPLNPGSCESTPSFGSQRTIEVLPEVAIAHQFPLNLWGLVMLYHVDIAVSSFNEDLTVRPNMYGPVCEQSNDSSCNLSACRASSKTPNLGVQDQAFTFLFGVGKHGLASANR